MTLSTVGTLVLIGIVAVVSPILAELTGRLAIPDVVFEIGLGIVIGPAVLSIDGAPGGRRSAVWSRSVLLMGPPSAGTAAQSLGKLPSSPPQALPRSR